MLELVENYPVDVVVSIVESWKGRPTLDYVCPTVQKLRDLQEMSTIYGKLKEAKDQL